MPRYFMQNTALAFYEREMTSIPGFGLRRIRQDALDNPTTAMFQMRDYRFPECEGTFVGTLVDKHWNGRNGLNCFFDTEDGHPVKLCAWINYERGTGCYPQYSDIDITSLPIGSVLRVKFRTTKSGKTKWLEAEILTPAKL